MKAQVPEGFARDETDGGRIGLYRTPETARTAVTTPVAIFDLRSAECRASRRSAGHSTIASLAARSTIHTRKFRRSAHASVKASCCVPALRMAP